MSSSYTFGGPGAFSAPGPRTANPAVGQLAGQPQQGQGAFVLFGGPQVPGSPVSSRQGPLPQMGGYPGVGMFGAQGSQQPGMGSTAFSGGNPMGSPVMNFIRPQGQQAQPFGGSFNNGGAPGAPRPAGAAQGLQGFRGMMSSMRPGMPFGAKPPTAIY